MKIKLRSIKAICLLLLPAMLLAGCNEKTTNVETDIGSEFESVNVDLPKVEDIVLAENGEAKYTIVYDLKSDDDICVANYLKFRLFELTGIVFKTVDHSLNTTENEILVGTTLSRKETEEVYSSFAQRKECAVAVRGNKLCLLSTQRPYNTVALMKFFDSVKWDSETKRLTIPGDMNYFSSSEKDTVNALMGTHEYVEIYQTVFNTYSSYREWRYATLDSENKKDQMLIEALIERMGNAAAFYEGSSSLLNTGYIRKLDTEDYSKVAKVVNGELLIPKQYAERYFGKTLIADADGYVNITVICKDNTDYSLYNTGKLYVLTPKEIEGFSDTSAKVGEYTNSEYITRMIEFFTTAQTPEPNNNTEQSRVVIDTKLFRENLADWSVTPYETLFQPSILCVKENGVDAIYISYEVNTVQEVFYSYDNKSTAYVKKSVDGGSTWNDVATIPGMSGGQLMLVAGDIYVMGSTLNRMAIIAKLDPSQVLGCSTEIICQDVNIVGGGPGTVAEKDGRIYRAYNAYVFSADVNSDLMKSESWVQSENIYDYFDAEWLSETKGMTNTLFQLMEPNVVIGPDGDIYVTERIDGIGRNLFLMLKLNEDGSFEYVGNRGIINMQTTWNRFAIKYDETTKKYIALTCVYTCGEHDRARRTLSIQTSSDLINWEIVDYVLVDREMVNPKYATWFHAFQYVDFEIEGDDIVMLVRESVGKANCYHDGTYITFYRMENFREVIA